MANVNSTCSVEGCVKPAKTRTLCSSHYHRLIRYGDPLIKKHRGRYEAIDWIRQAITLETDECIIYPFTIGPKGYGRIFFDGREATAHRTALILHSGVNHRHLYACHAPKICHNRLCVNVNAGHVFWDTVTENNRHKVLDGTDQRGEKNGVAKLSSYDVIAIREDNRLHRVIAATYKIDRTTVGDIKRRKIWKHIP